MRPWLRSLFGPPSNDEVATTNDARFLGGEPTRCTCVCHGAIAASHVQPCCAPCERCSVRFLAGLEKHRANCDA